ncbi:MAG: YceI family protein [Armatimonadetes bacterium]|nr:YceI family protein [Armatimonadota bacterium]
MRRGSWLAVPVVLAVLAAWAADMVTYLADDPIHRDCITITSDAPLEFMVTRTQEVTGTVQVNPDNILDRPTAHFELDAAKLSNGIPLRDQIMRGPDWLDVDQFPKVTFDLKQVKSPNQPTPLKPGQSLSIDVVGSLSLKGRTLDVPATIVVTALPADDETATRLPGDLLKVAASFDIFLTDFGIDLGPKAVRKVANRQHVDVRILTSTKKFVPPTR